jgi:hypothetical protein
MAMSINSSTSGFWKWSEAQELKRVDEARAAGVDDVIATPEADQGVMTQDEKPHRPWLVPGQGKL